MIKCLGKEPDKVENQGAFHIVPWSSSVTLAKPLISLNLMRITLSSTSQCVMRMNYYFKSL